MDLTQVIESKGKPWVSELECSRHSRWADRWQRIDEVAAALRHAQPESFRMVQVCCRRGERKPFGVFSKTVRLKR